MNYIFRMLKEHKKETLEIKNLIIEKEANLKELSNEIQRLEKYLNI